MGTDFRSDTTRARCHFTRRAFTLVELLVVIAIIGILVALLLPAIQVARQASQKASCSNNLRQIGIGLANYEDVHRYFPIGCLGCKLGSTKSIAWNVPLLPFIDEESLGSQFNFDYSSKSSENRTVTNFQVGTFLCPSVGSKPVLNGEIIKNGKWDPGEDMAFTDYCGLYGVEGPGRNNTDFTSLHNLRDTSLGVMLYEIPTARKEISDGLATTAVIGECAARKLRQSEWANGHNVFAQHQDTPINASDNDELFSYHGNGAFVAFGDGHVAFLQETMDQAVLLALLTRAGDDIVGDY